MRGRNVHRQVLDLYGDKQLVVSPLEGREADGGEPAMLISCAGMR